jgi:hypothetical protein
MKSALDFAKGKLAKRSLKFFSYSDNFECCNFIFAKEAAF